MRTESVELLRTVAIQRLGHAGGPDGRRGLTRSDIEYIVRAMEIVSSHPIPTFELPQSGASQKQRREVWTSLRRTLSELQLSVAESDIANQQPRSFCPPL